MLREVTHGFGRNLFGALDGDNLFFLHDELTGVADNGIERNNTFFDGIHPGKVNVLLKVPVEQREVVLAALHGVKKTFVEVAAVRERLYILFVL
ncbi:hypothetical protein SDC9_195699 [bioreactor metagenome]|uniref:Uncharacterized protein n=1 Tax=bioreactor metagenome TaxID=1076179 RepID=A0A645I9S0_9ZZZZ